MPRKSKEYNGNGYDLSNLEPYLSRAKRLDAEMEEAKQAIKDLYAEIKGHGYPKEVIDVFKDVLKADKRGIDIKKAQDTLFWDIARAVGVANESGSFL